MASQESERRVWQAVWDTVIAKGAALRAGRIPRTQRGILGTLIGSLALIAVAWCGAMAWTEWHAQLTIKHLTAVETAGKAKEDVSLRAFVRWLDDTRPPFGGSPGEWDARSRGYLLAAQQLHLDKTTTRTLLRKSKAAAKRALQMNPVAHGPWSRVAVTSELLNGGVDDETIKALKNARLSAPYRPELAAWRLQYELSLWSELPPDIHRDALYDAEFVFSKSPQVVRSLYAKAGPEAQAALAARIPALAPPPPVQSASPQD